MDAESNMIRKPNPVWLDMPVHVKQKCVDFANAQTKHSLRRCCKATKKLVDKASNYYQSLEIEFGRHRTTVKLELVEGNFLQMDFRASGEGCELKNPASKYFLKFKDTTPVEEAGLLFTKYLTKPKTSFETIEIREGVDLIRDRGYNIRRAQQFSHRLEESLENMQHQLYVKKISAPSRSVSNLLRYSKSKYLTCIDIMREDVMSAPLLPLTTLEQWRNLTRVEINFVSDISIDMFFDFKSWKSHVGRITALIVEKLIQNCKLDNSCTVTSREADEEDIKRLFVNYVLHMDEENQKTYIFTTPISKFEVEELRVTTYFLPNNFYYLSVDKRIR